MEIAMIANPFSPRRSGRLPTEHKPDRTEQRKLALLSVQALGLSTWGKILVALVVVSHRWPVYRLHYATQESEGGVGVALGVCNDKLGLQNCMPACVCVECRSDLATG